MAKVVESFWKNKKVFLTGHTGFKGSWLALWLHKMGAQVTGYALEPQTETNLFEIAQVESLINSHIGNINNFVELKAAIKKAQPDIVFHMAAQALVKYSYEFPIETFQTNVMGTVHLLEACRGIDSIKSVVNVTSDKCYENFERQKGYREDEPMGGYDPYSSSKGCSELVTSAYRRSFYSNSKVGIASARAGNVIGGGDWSQDRLFPDIFRALVKKSPVVIRNPGAIRPWQHVLEPLSGYLTLAQKLYEKPENYSEGFNFGPYEQDAKTVEYIVDKAVGYWGQGASFSIDKSYSGPHEAHFLKLDISKAQKVLNWKPTWNLDKTLQETVRWYEKFSKSPESIVAMTYNQIDAFERDSSDTSG